LKIGYIGSLKWKKFLQTAILGYIYLHTNKTLIPYFIYVFDNWGKNLSHRKMRYNHSNVYAKGQQDLDNQHPDKWNSIITATYFNFEYCVKSRFKSEKSTVKMSQTEAATILYYSYHHYIIRRM
jgi:hypothetical protein